jgi:polar amino acid transport system permease protein
MNRSAPPPSEPLTVAPTRHPWRWVAIAVIGVLVTMFIHTLIANPRFQLNLVARYFFDTRILGGLVLTLELTAIAMAIGIVLGIIVAVLQMSPNPVISTASRFYVWLFRGTPVLVQLLFWFNLAALYPRLSLGIPFGPEFISGSANSFITAYAAAILGLGLNEGAYMAEIVRAGILSVNHGQTEAAQALGMPRTMVLRRVVLPQAMRVIVPPTGNQVISMLKTTALVSVLAVSELLYSVQLIYAVNYQTIPLLIVASLWYLIFTTVLTMLQNVLEKRFGRGERSVAATPWQRLAEKLRTRNERMVDA